MTVKYAAVGNPSIVDRDVIRGEVGFSSIFQQQLPNTVAVRIFLRHIFTQVSCGNNTSFCTAHHRPFNKGKIFSNVFEIFHPPPFI